MNKATIFMNAGWVGLAGIAATATSLIEAIPDAVTGIGMAITFVACWVMLFTRNADEYTRGLWTSGASLAFATLLIMFLGLPYAEGFYDGLRTSLEDRDDDYYQQDIPAIASIILAIAAFYIGLFWRRVRGG